MSLYDKASLIMTPSGVKAEKLYSHKPHNGNGDFTHDRSAGTATRVNKDGLIETVAADVPRLNYPLIDGVVQDTPHFLLEPAKTQLIQYSEDFSQTYWIKTRVTVTVNQAISPDGNNTADYLEQTSGQTVSGAVVKLISFTAASYTFSVFAKKKEKTFLRLAEASSSGNGTVSSTYFDLDNGTIGTSHSNHTAKMENFGDGWYRCAITFTGTAANNNAIIYIADSDNSSTVTDSGGLYIFGAQLEQSSFLTSYIPNDGTTATITRNADVCNSAGTSAEFNDSEGVLYAEIAALAMSSNYRFLGISDGSTSNRVQIVFNNANQFALYIQGGGSAISDANQLQFNKAAVKYKSGDNAFWVNGFEIGSNGSSGNSTSGLNVLSFDIDSQSTYDFEGKTKELAVFKEALTDSELEALTSWTSFDEMATGQEYTIR